MADGININIRVKVTNGGFVDPYTKNLDITQAAQGFSGNIQVIGTGAHELLTINSDIGTAGIAILENLGTNYVEIGNDVSGTFSPFLKITGGGSNVLSLAHKNVYAKANTASVRLLVKVYEA